MSDDRRWPRWDGPRLSMAEHADFIAIVRASGTVAHWKAYDGPDDLEGFAYGNVDCPSALEIARSIAEAALRARGILAPDAEVWR